MQTKVAVLVLLFVVSISLFFRTYNVENTTRVFSDSGRDFLVAKKIAEGSAPYNPYLASSSGFESTPIYYWVIAFFWSIGRSIENTITIYSVTLAIATPLIFYLIGKEIHSKELGLFLAFYSSIQPYFVGLSRWIWQPNVLILLIPTLYLFFLYNKKVLLRKNQHKEKFIHIFLLFLILNLNIHIHFSSIVCVSFLISILIYELLKNKKILLAISVGLGFISSVLIRAIVVNIATPTIFGVGLNLNQMLINYKQIIGSYDKTIFLNEWSEKPSFFPNMILLLVFLSIYSFKKHKKLPNQLITLLIGSLLSFITVVYPKTVYTYFYIPQLVLFHILFGSILYFFMKIKIQICSKFCFALITIIICGYYIAHTYQIIHTTNEIKISQILSLEIYKDYNTNHLSIFSIDFVPNNYGQTDHQSTFDAILWLQMESLMKTQLVKIGTTSPTIIEPNNPKITYYVLGNSDLVVPQKNTVKIFERKIEGDTYSIYKELAL